MWRLDRGAQRIDHRAASITIGAAACLYCVGVAVGQSQDLVFKAMIALLRTMPLFALVRLDAGKPQIESRATSIRARRRDGRTSACLPLGGPKCSA
jgi:hypothetical protein